MKLCSKLVMSEVFTLGSFSGLLMPLLSEFVQNAVYRGRFLKGKLSCAFEMKSYGVSLLLVQDVKPKDESRSGE